MESTTTSARELGYKEKPDSFQAAHAFKEKRFQLTKNAKHFLDDRKVPFTRLRGVVVIEGDMSVTESYSGSLNDPNSARHFLYNANRLY